MSRIYSYEEIQQFPLPTAETFAHELDAVRDGLEGMHADGLITGALLFGSATYAATSRSDIDLRMATPDITPALLDRTRSLVDGVYNRSGIAVDTTCQTEYELRSGEYEPHTRAPMIAWLTMQTAEQPENIIGENIVQMMHPPRADLLESVDVYMGGVLRKLTRLYLKVPPPSPYAVLEEALDAPLKLGRESVAALQHRGLVPMGTLKSAGRMAVAMAATGTLGRHDPRITNLYGDMTAEFDQYGNIVEEVRAGTLAKAAYEAVLAETAARCLPKAIALAAGVQKAFRMASTPVAEQQ